MATALFVSVLSLMMVPAGAVTNIISPGDQVFIGEEGLNITAAVPEGFNQIAWFSPGSSPETDTPAMILTVGSKQNFYVQPSQFKGATGSWYLWNQTAGDTAFQVSSPTLNLRIWDQRTNQDVSNRGVAPGSLVNFRIETNLVSIPQRAGYDPANDGYISVLLVTPTGATLTAVIDQNGTPLSLQDLSVDTLPWYWVPQGTESGWDTGAGSPAGGRLYPSGTYTARLDYNVNNLQNNLQGEPGIGKPSPVQVTLASEQVTIAANAPEVIRGNPFSLTISGVPGAAYYLWVRNTGSQSGAPGNQPPLITLNQEGVMLDPIGGPYVIGAHPIPNRQGVTIRDDVPPAPANGTRYYALVTLSNSGTRTVQWQTSTATDTRRFTFEVERSFADRVLSDEVSVNVVRGSISIVTGQPRFTYLGEEVILLGTSSASDTVYLFMTGPNLPASGGSLTSPELPVVTGQPGTFTSVQVGSDSTWEYRWHTGNLGIDAGSYTVYAVSSPSSRNNLANTPFSTTSIVFATPFITTFVPDTGVARGDPVEISGTATGNPSPGVAIWIFGINRFIYSTATVNSDSTFSYELNGAETSTLASGQYYVIVQHPGYTNTFDVYPDSSRELVLSTYPVPGSVIFRVAGPGALMSSQAADALITALNSPFIDDTYSSLQFQLVTPRITIDPLFGNHSVGETIDLSGTTNLAAGDQLLVEVTSESFGPTQKDQPGAFSGASGTVSVRAGVGGINIWNFTFDTRSFVPDTYLVQVSGVTVPDATATSSFVLSAVTPVPTPTPTPSPLPTTLPTTVPTTVPTTETPLSVMGVMGALGIALVLYLFSSRRGS
jgi:hypothetical protein